MWSKSTIEPKKWRISTKCKHRTTTNDQENHCELKLASRKEWSSFRSVLQCEHLTWCECCFRDFGFSVCVCAVLFWVLPKTHVSMFGDGVVGVVVVSRDCEREKSRKRVLPMCRAVSTHHEKYEWHFLSATFYSPFKSHTHNISFQQFSHTHNANYAVKQTNWKLQCFMHDENGRCVCVCCGNNVNRTTGHKLLRNFPLSQPYSSA